MSAVPVVTYNIKVYLEIEASTGKRYEFYDGELFEVEGASISHNRIVMSTINAIVPHLDGKKCEAFASQLKVLARLNNSITYPDITIVCDGIQTALESKDIVTNPAVIIEVISPSTGDYDHGEKFRSYRALPSLREYILISSKEVLVEKFTKQNNMRWIMDVYKKREQVFTIDTIALQIPLSEVYRNTDLPELED